MLCMLKMLKMVFVAFMQHSIQSTVTHFVTHVEGIEGVKYYVLYSVNRASSPSKGESYLLVEKPSILWFSGSPPVSPRRQLC